MFLLEPSYKEYEENFSEMEINQSRNTYLQHCVVIMKGRRVGGFSNEAGWRGRRGSGQALPSPECRGLPCGGVNNSSCCASCRAGRFKCKNGWKWPLSYKGLVKWYMHFSFLFNTQRQYVLTAWALESHRIPRFAMQTSPSPPMRRINISLFPFPHL